MQIPILTVIEKKVGVVDNNKLFKYSCAAGDLNTVQALCPSVDVNMDFGLPLYYAMEYKHYDIVKYLILAGADITVFNYAVIDFSILDENIDLLVFVTSHIFKGAEVTKDNMWDFLTKYIFGKIREEDTIAFDSICSNMNKSKMDNVNLPERHRILFQLKNIF